MGVLKHTMADLSTPFFPHRGFLVVLQVQTSRRSSRGGGNVRNQDLTCPVRSQDPDRAWSVIQPSHVSVLGAYTVYPSLYAWRVHSPAFTLISVIQYSSTLSFMCISSQYLYTSLHCKRSTLRGKMLR